MANYTLQIKWTYLRISVEKGTSSCGWSEHFGYSTGTQIASEIVASVDLYNPCGQCAMRACVLTGEDFFKWQKIKTMKGFLKNATILTKGLGWSSSTSMWLIANSDKLCRQQHYWKKIQSSRAEIKSKMMEILKCAWHLSQVIKAIKLLLQLIKY